VTQGEIDELWEKLTRGGEAVECDRLNDRYGLSWQIVPAVLGEMMSDPDPARSQRVTEELLKMKKLDQAELEKGFRGARPTACSNHRGLWYPW